MLQIRKRLLNAWNVFRGRDPTEYQYISSMGYSQDYRNSRTNYSGINNRTTLVSIYNKIAVDVSNIPFRHVYLDEDDKYKSTVNSNLNEVLKLDANIDQTGKELIRDVVLTTLNNGVSALVPTYTTEDPLKTESYDIKEARVGRIVSWSSYHIKVEVYNVESGRKEEITLPKSICPIIENPFYAVMNEPNSTVSRLRNVQGQIDKMNSDAAQGKFNLIIQAPYAIRTKNKQQMSDMRRQEIEEQLSNSPHGIAYLDATEHVIQLNRPLENDLWRQYQDLQTEMLNEMGIAKEIFDGTANEVQQMNYYDRVITPFLFTISEAIERRWLSKTARTQKQAIRYFRNPFVSVPLSNIADVFDKLKKNEVITANECRSEIGLKPIDDGRADRLVNASINVQENINEEKNIDKDDNEIQNE